MIKLLRKLVVYLLPYSSAYRKFVKSKLQASYIDFLKFKLGLSKEHWPVHKTCTIANYNKIFVGINALVGRPGSYIQGAGEVYFGKYVRLAPNVGILSSNHDIYNQQIRHHKTIIIGDYSWIGMNSVVLAGVVLGTRTVVAAGSVVTKSFPEGFCVIGGVPAKIIKKLDKDKFVPWKEEEEYYGFIPKDEFEKKNKEIIKKMNIKIGL